MKTKRIFFSFVIFLFLAGCANIPKESVELSSAVDNGIREQQIAYQNLFNSYFNLKKEKIDEWIKSNFIPVYMKSVKAIMQAESKKEFDEEAISYFIDAIIEKRDSMQMDLEKVKVVLWERISQDHVILLNASQQVTLLLKSAAEVQESTNSLLQSTSKATGVDFIKLDQVFNDYLLKAGDISGKGSSLLEEITPLLNKEE